MVLVAALPVLCLSRYCEAWFTTGFRVGSCCHAPLALASAFPQIEDRRSGWVKSLGGFTTLVVCVECGPELCAARRLLTRGD